jgi:hypothetical protein
MGAGGTADWRFASHCPALPWRSEVDMKKKLYSAMFAIVIAGSAAGLSAAAGDPPPGSALPLINLAVLNAIPPPADDPLLDANGNVVLDASGNPVSDPNETFHLVKPFVFDPFHTSLVESGWLDGIGCPTGANTEVFVPPAFTSLSASTYTDPACPPPGDSKDTKNEGLLLVKTGPEANDASAGAELKKVRGITLHELGYDIRKHGGSASMFGSHCGAGAPRFNVQTTDGLFGVGCQSPPPDMETVGDGFTRLRWGVGGVVMGFKDFTTLMPITGTVIRIEIIFDDGTDTAGGTDQFGAAILDNIDVNGEVVGQGPTTS